MQGDTNLFCLRFFKIVYEIKCKFFMEFLFVFHSKLIPANSAEYSPPRLMMCR